jgi:hypothetical protein
LLGDVSQEGAYGGQFSSRRRRAQPVCAPVSKESAEIGSLDAGQRCNVDQLAAITSEEVDQAMRGSNIGAHGMGRTAPIML